MENEQNEIYGLINVDCDCNSNKLYVCENLTNV